MAYLVLARKWRPQQFSDVVGQEPIIRTLENAIRLERVSHAILFTGSRGVGKTTSARILAKALNCEKGPTTTPCDQCSNCREIAAGTNVDVLEIDGASNTHVEDIRDLLDKVRYTPSKSKHKIYIIDEVHMLSKSAFNALLKTLEEPPAGVLFMFATTEPHKIPETILSRCQRFDLTQILEEAMARHLRKIADAEKLDVDDGAIALVARQADGSLRDALSALDRILAFSGDRISEADAASILGLTDRELISRTMESLVAHDSKAALDVLDDVLGKGFDPKNYLLEVWGKIRDLLVLKSGGDERLVQATSDERERYRGWVAKLSEGEVERWFDLFRRASDELRRTEFPRFLMEITFLRATRQPPALSMVQVVERLEALERRLGGSSPSPAIPSGGSGGRAKPREATPLSSAAPKSETPTPVASDATTSDGEISESTSPDRDALLAAVKRKKPAMAAILLQATKYDVAPGKVILEYDEGSFFVSRAKDDDFQKFLLGTAQELFGGTFGIDIRTSVRSASPSRSPITLDRAREKEALEHPTIRQAVSVFQAKIEEIKPVK